MKQDEITIPSLKGQQNIAVDYSDDDIIIIDNIKKLVEPSPTRLKMNLIAIVVGGRAQVDMNGQSIELGERQLLLCPPNVVFSNFMISPDFEFKALFCTNEILQSFLREKINIWNEVMYIHKAHVVTMDESDIEYFSRFYDLLRLYIDRMTGNPYRSEIIQSIIRGAILGLCGSLKLMLPHEKPSRMDQNRNLFQRFLNLVNSSSVKYGKVSDYAAKLCVTPKHLSTSCRKASGRPASEWIEESVKEDIRYCLISTDLSVSQISDKLGFPNPSFFCKYVREHFGTTALEIRQRHLGDGRGSHAPVDLHQ
ncbi:MAG: AraC family transcriptional regulator [Bacteroidaceae bacterium]|nr:AraC family transcriptional regulator [Bacteroidaceae bacterium]